MDFLFEFLFGALFEVPMEMAMESKTLKPWVKTAIVFVVCNLLTALMAAIAISLYREDSADNGWQVAVIFGVVLFVTSLVVCTSGHRRGWQRERTCPLEKTVVTAPARNTPNPNVTIRTACLTDLDAIAAVEAECFPAAEAASREAFKARLTHYANHFWLMFDGDRLISFVDGFVTDEADLTDEMFANAAMHNEAGAWQMIFGVNTLPAYRCHGYAAQLIEQAILDAKAQGRKGVVLTCKPEKVPYYMKFGFKNEGISQNSTHGVATWHQMRLSFDT